MKLDNFKSFLRRKPFKAFSIFTASGESYYVPSPESIAISPDGNDVIVWPPTGGLAMLDFESITEVMYPSVNKPPKEPKRTH